MGRTAQGSLCPRSSRKNLVSLPAPLSAETLKGNTREAAQWHGADQALGPCWVATRGYFCRFGYCREDYRIRGLGGKQKRLSTHILAWLLEHLGPLERDDLYLAYLELRASGLQVEHKCESTGCRRPSHLELLTQSENIAASKERAYQRSLARGAVESFEPD